MCPHQAVTASPQLAGGVGVGPVDCAAVYEGTQGVHLFPGVIFSADGIRPREGKAMLLAAIEAVSRDVDIEAKSELLRLLHILQSDPGVTALEI